MTSIEKRLIRAWKKKRGMRLSAEEVELLICRGLQYLSAQAQAESDAALAGSNPSTFAAHPQIDSPQSANA